MRLSGHVCFLAPDYEIMAVWTLHKLDPVGGVGPKAGKSSSLGTGKIKARPVVTLFLPVTLREFP